MCSKLGWLWLLSLTGGIMVSVTGKYVTCSTLNRTAACISVCGRRLYRHLLFTTDLKVIPKKKKLPMYIFETFPKCSPVPNAVSKKAIKLKRDRACLKDVMSQSYSIYAFTHTNYARYSSVHVTFCGSWKHS